MQIYRRYVFELPIQLLRHDFTNYSNVNNKFLQIPSTIGEEKRINPFMRVLQTSVQHHAGTSDGIATMAAIRKEKDSFKA